MKQSVSNKISVKVATLCLEVIFYSEASLADEDYMVFKFKKLQYML